MKRKTRPTKAGLNKFFPSPPKAILVTTIAIKQPTKIIHIGILLGKLKASNRPVIIAELSVTVLPLCNRYFDTRYSNKTQPATAVSITYEVEYFGVIGSVNVSLEAEESKIVLLVVSEAREDNDVPFHQLKVTSGGENGYDVTIYGYRAV